VNVPDPARPRVRDAFLDDDGTRVTMATVGPTVAIVRHPTDGDNIVRRSVVATWTPAPPPLIEDDVTFHEWRSEITSGWTEVSHPIYATGNVIVLHPGGTYTEVPA
jgi:hypothetical protein